jgi:hypothetical protein
MRPVGLDADSAHQGHAAESDSDGKGAQHANALAEQRPGEGGSHQRRQRLQEENLGSASGFDGGNKTNLTRRHGEH